VTVTVTVTGVRGSRGRGYNRARNP
jgi:hypothetical protein